MGSYSGGAENFPRFLETWTGLKLTYYGSMVELYKSQQSIGEWGKSGVYSPPGRQWYFDYNFKATPPPGSIMVLQLRQRQMVHSLTLLLLGALFATSARADLQLTPKVSESWLDGAKVKFLAFSDGNGKDVTYGPPSGWEYSGSSTRFTLHPPSKPQAEGTIARINLSHPAVFDDETMKKLTAEVLASVPGGSTNVTLVSQEKNLLMIQRKETFLIILSYTFYGQKYGRSILFLNRGNEQIRSQLTCREADFKELHRAFLASQYTWQNL